MCKVKLGLMIRVPDNTRILKCHQKNKLRKIVEWAMMVMTRSMRAALSADPSSSLPSCGQPAPPGACCQTRSAYPKVCLDHAQSEYVQNGLATLSLPSIGHVVIVAPGRHLSQPSTHCGINSDHCGLRVILGLMRSHGQANVC